MLGLPRRSENKPGVAAVKNADQRSAQNLGGRRRPVYNVLVPMMIGSQMVLIPRPEGGRSLDWPTSIPAKE